jgi:hypothetical protein
VGQATGQILVLAVGVALSPLPIIAVILLLTRPDGRAAGWWFVAGWALALTLLGTAVLLVADDAHASESGAAATWVGAVQIVLAVLLLGAAVSQWRARPGGEDDPESPSWMLKVEAFTPAQAAGAAALFAAVKPKNLLLTVAAGTAVAQTGAGAAQQAGALAIFVALATAGLLAPVAIQILTGDRAERILGGLRDWMVRENSTIVAVICLVIAVKLLGDGITVLAG